MNSSNAFDEKSKVSGDSNMVRTDVNRSRIEAGAASCGINAASSRRFKAHGDNIEVNVSPWRVFINHIDSYHARKLTDLLSEQLYIQTSYTTVDSVGDVATENEDEQSSEEGEWEKKDNQEAGMTTKKKLNPRKFELIGTVLNSESLLCDDITVVPSLRDNEDKFISEILKCGFIVYDITQEESQVDEAILVLDELARILDEQQQCAKSRRLFNTRHFVLISSVMTWARSKAGQQPMTEADYRKRRAHAHFKEQLRCERHVATLGKRRAANLGGALRTLVICAGLIYGDEEADLHYAFKLAWLNERRLPCLGSGRNLLPLLHVRDLAAAVYSFTRGWPKLRYVVAVEPGLSSQRRILLAISKALSTGKLSSVSVHEALSYGEVTQRVVDAATLDLNIQPDYLMKSEHMKWQSRLSFCENIEQIVDEYRAGRNLSPIRLIVLGPPASGKTSMARSLALRYRLHYVALEELIADTILQLSSEIEEATEARENSDEESEEVANRSLDGSEIAAVESLQEMLREIQTGLQENNGRLADDVLTKVVKRKLLSKECQNQGYVLDGYPKTLDQANLLFGAEEDNAEEGRSENVAPPDHVIVLEAGDEFLMERALYNLPEREFRHTEERVLGRLRRYRERNDEYNTPLQLFDEIEVHPLIVNVEEDKSAQMASTLRYCLNVIGSPRNYGPSAEELEEERKRTEADVSAKAAQAAAQVERELVEMRRERQKRAVEWLDLLEKLKHEEEESLRIAAEPLRRYLMKCVFPILTQGLVEVAKLRPTDPIDYLAEYLFKANPEGKLFEPDYGEAMSSALASMGRLQSDGALGIDASGVIHEHSRIPDEEDGRAACRCSTDEDRWSRADTAATSVSECRAAEKCGCSSLSSSCLGAGASETLHWP